MSEYLNAVLDEPKKFVKESIQLLNRCAKPDRREYMKVAQAVSVGFLLMGLIGFFIQIIHIPIRKLIV